MFSMECIVKQLSVFNCLVCCDNYILYATVLQSALLHFFMLMLGFSLSDLKTLFFCHNICFLIGCFLLMFIYASVDIHCA